MANPELVVAKLAEQAERYEEVIEYMNAVVQQKQDLAEDLTIEERNLLSVGYQNVVGSRRSSLLIIRSILAKEEEKGGENTTIIKSYKETLEDELNSICINILDLLKNYLEKAASNAEALVFYLKMKGDYNKYLAEFSAGDSRKIQGAEDANAAYEMAYKKARDLAPTHPIRLGLALNYSVFLYEMQCEVAGACEIAKQAFECAIEGLDTLDEESFKKSALIMQVLRDNLTLWASDDE